MDEQQDDRLEPGQDELRRKLSSGPGRLWAGLFAILVGGVLLLDALGFPLPDWLFSWHILLVAIGLFLGLRHNFRGGAWLILILVGGCFLIQDFYPKAELRRYIGPCVLILIGFIIMFRPKRSWRHNEWKHEWKDQMHRKWHNEWERQYWSRRWGHHGHNQPYQNQPYQNQPIQSQPFENTGQQPDPEAGPTSQAATGSQTSQQGQGPWQNQAQSQNPNQNQSQGQSQGQSQNGEPYSNEDYIDTTSIFGGVHKKVVSKNFRGGDIVTFLGGSEIDLSQAEIFGTARLDVTQVMGGTKIIVPAHWEVRSHVTALFAGFEDKRQQPAAINPDKILIIDGTSIFGGIELKNY